MFEELSCWTSGHILCSFREWDKNKWGKFQKADFTAPWRKGETFGKGSVWSKRWANKGLRRPCQGAEESLLWPGNLCPLSVLSYIWGRHLEVVWTDLRQRALQPITPARTGLFKNYLCICGWPPSAWWLGFHEGIPTVVRTVQLPLWLNRKWPADNPQAHSPHPPLPGSTHRQMHFYSQSHHCMLRSRMCWDSSVGDQGSPAHLSDA